MLSYGTTFGVTLERRGRVVHLELECPTSDEAIELFDGLLAGVRRSGGIARVVEHEAEAGA